MSRVGKKPIAVPDNVKVEIAGKTVKVSGPKGSLQLDCHPNIDVRYDSDAKVIVLENPNPGSRFDKALHGTMRALINNMVAGVTAGFEQKMEIYGTGYSVKEQSGKLVIQVGFSHPVELDIPETVKVQIDVPATKGNDIPARFTLTGYDKQQLGQFAASIRKVKPPEPYQGKGIRFAGEHIKHKVGKAFAGGAA